MGLRADDKDLPGRGRGIQHCLHHNRSRRGRTLTGAEPLGTLPTAVFSNLLQSVTHLRICSGGWREKTLQAGEQRGVVEKTRAFAETDLGLKLR